MATSDFLNSFLKGYKVGSGIIADRERLQRERERMAITKQQAEQQATLFRQQQGEYARKEQDRKITERARMHFAAALDPKSGRLDYEKFNALLTNDPVLKPFLDTITQSVTGQPSEFAGVKPNPADPRTSVVEVRLANGQKDVLADGPDENAGVFLLPNEATQGPIATGIELLAARAPEFYNNVLTIMAAQRKKDALRDFGELLVGGGPALATDRSTLDQGARVVRVARAPTQSGAPGAAPQSPVPTPQPVVPVPASTEPTSAPASTEQAPVQPAADNKPDLLAATQVAEVMRRVDALNKEYMHLREARRTPGSDVTDSDVEAARADLADAQRQLVELTSKSPDVMPLAEKIYKQGGPTAFQGGQIVREQLSQSAAPMLNAYDAFREKVFNTERAAVGKVADLGTKALDFARGFFGGDQQPPAQAPAQPQQPQPQQPQPQQPQPQQPQTQVPAQITDVTQARQFVHTTFQSSSHRASPRARKVIVEALVNGIITPQQAIGLFKSDDKVTWHNVDGKLVATKGSRVVSVYNPKAGVDGIENAEEGLKLADLKGKVAKRWDDRVKRLTEIFFGKKPPREQQAWFASELSRLSNILGLDINDNTTEAALKTALQTIQSQRGFIDRHFPDFLGGDDLTDYSLVQAYLAAGLNMSYEDAQQYVTQALTQTLQKTNGPADARTVSKLSEVVISLVGRGVDGKQAAFLVNQAVASDPRIALLVHKLPPAQVAQVLLQSLRANGQ